MAAKKAPARKAQPAPKQPTLQIIGQPAKPLGGARGKWWAALQKYNGKPVAAFVTHVLANPPSTPKKGKLAGKCEPPAGWVNWFVRQGLVKVVQ